MHPRHLPLQNLQPLQPLPVTLTQRLCHRRPDQHCWRHYEELAAWLQIKQRQVDIGLYIKTFE